MCCAMEVLSNYFLCCAYFLEHTSYLVRLNFDECYLESLLLDITSLSKIQEPTWRSVLTSWRLILVTSR